MPTGAKAGPQKAEQKSPGSLSTGQEVDQSDCQHQQTGCYDLHFVALRPQGWLVNVLFSFLGITQAGVV